MSKAVARKLDEFIARHLPTAQHMQLAVADYDSHSLTLTAPLGPSINDKLTDVSLQGITPLRTLNRNLPSMGHGTHLVYIIN